MTLLMESYFLFSVLVVGNSRAIREIGEQREGGSGGGLYFSVGMRHFSPAAGQQEAPKSTD